MPFCKYCGKELEEGAVCGCSDALREALAKSTLDEEAEKADSTPDTSDTDLDSASVYEAMTKDMENVEKEASDETSVSGTVSLKKDDAPAETEEIPGISASDNAVYEAVINDGFDDAPAEEAKVPDTSDSSDAVSEEKSDAAASTEETSSSESKTIIPNRSDGPAIRRVDTGVNERKPDDDAGLKKFGALVAAVLVVFTIVVGCMAAGSGYKGTVKKYFRSRYSKHGGKTYYTLILPDDGIAELKDNDEWQELVEDYNDDVEDRMDDWDKKPRFRKISKVKDMKNNELKDAEKYFYSAAEVCDADVDEEDFHVKKGYAVTYKYKNTDGDNEKTTIYVVKLKGEGWKVMSGLGTSFFGLD